jgi:hypothetical protein
MCQFSLQAKRNSRLKELGSHGVAAFSKTHKVKLAYREAERMVEYRKNRTDTVLYSTRKEAELRHVT